ncbi:WecB/TagA/CpsF family glycosyltransferase [Oharaeibacter diazotrophicus]|uniref:Exopolysaccharide biosynthesis WecB/TagA/CpsF family protein n=1 Tax=Oharaeibacter diazotrophicus TaxID=1920512 RepID=A0A4R6R8U1_9HYPH|nr:WecB/TagA/CpsF family glycosyltransferase [Oharaeibacter diazotrophicus]TDP82379.1 exopolysaccharide biosynthesis WecB/TagA/CpsF family protein [Oharaeibacter diazotrophicus]BBE72858.1 UDP-N-acetyl-D-mannosaminuronic acid transferase [Pleomorphomonas sp. SM30]GLS76897.1 hypothetical protein GCM10007904_22340 [Oharaeibacter diazotrophicus]
MASPLLMNGRIGTDDPAMTRMVTTVHVSSIPTPAAKRSGRARPAGLARVAGTLLNVGDQDALVRGIVDDAVDGAGGTVFTLNLDHLVKLDESPAFRLAYDRARYVTADGTPIVWMARAAGAPLHRVTGADLVLPLCRAAAVHGLGVHLFGTSDAVLAVTADRLRALIPGLDVVGTEAPPYGFDPASPAAAEAAARIAASGARICFVALGAPKQELFSDQALAHAPGVTFVCIGAALDFIAGTQRRAPRILQATGLEWSWRLAHDPRRLARRYWLSGLFLARWTVRHAGGAAADLFRGIARDFRNPDRK